MSGEQPGGPPSPSLADKPDADGHPVDPLPVFSPRDWQPDEQYPLFLINWKEASHTHTRTHPPSPAHAPPPTLNWHPYRRLPRAVSL